MESNSNNSSLLNAFWTIWNLAVDAEAVIFGFLIAPFVGVGRAATKMHHNSVCSEIRSEYEATREQMRLNCQKAVDFFALYMEKEGELDKRFYRGHYGSIEDAKSAYQVRRLSRQLLIRQAEHMINRE